MAQVYINGVLLIPGIDYSIANSKISFATPPDSGSHIDIRRGPGELTTIVGNGHRYMFDLNEHWAHYEHIQALIQETWKYKDVPAVADQLEKLKVVLELIKQDDSLR